MSDAQYDETVHTKTLVSGYQHVANGGISFDLEKSNWVRHEGTPNDGLHLKIRLSNHGVPMELTIPVFKTTADILREIADVIEAEPRDASQFNYLGHMYAQITDADDTERYYVCPHGSQYTTQVPRESIFGGDAQQCSSVGCSEDSDDDPVADEDNRSIEELIAKYKLRIDIPTAVAPTRWYAHAPADGETTDAYLGGISGAGTSIREAVLECVDLIENPQYATMAEESEVEENGGEHDAD
jgi:hypothetical protein